MTHFRKPNFIIIGILISIILIEFIPYIITIISPDLCYGCTSIGKFQQKINNEYNLGYIVWFSYICLFFYIIYLASIFKIQHYISFHISNIYSYYAIIGSNNRSIKYIFQKPTIYA
jgi:hypothetical protein